MISIADFTRSNNAMRVSRLTCIQLFVGNFVYYVISKYAAFNPDLPCIEKSFLSKFFGQDCDLKILQKPSTGYWHDFAFEEITLGVFLIHLFSPLVFTDWTTVLSCQP